MPHPEGNRTPAAGRLENKPASRTDTSGTPIDGLDPAVAAGIGQAGYEGLERFIAETSNIAVLITDVAGNLVWCNRGFEATSGYALDEVRGLSPGAVLQGPETNAETVAFMRRQLRDGRGFQTEILNYTKAGAPYWISLEVHPVRSAEGELTHFTSIQYDITRLKETERLALRAERQQATLARLGQATLADPSPERLLDEAARLTASTLEVEMGLVLELGPDAETLYPRASVGWDSETLRNARFQATDTTQAGQAIANRGPVVAPDLDREERFSDTNIARGEGARAGLVVPIEGSDAPFGVLAIHTTHARRFTVDDINFTKSVASLVGQALVRADAEHALRRMHADLERRIEERTTDLRRINAKLEEEVTERKRVEHALRASETFLQSALDALSAHVAILDTAGTILAVNKAWRVFANENDFDSESAALGLNYIDVCRNAADNGSPESALMLEGLRDVLENRREAFFLQYPCHSPDEERWFQARVSRFEAGGEVRLVVSHENITEAKQHERKMLDHMAALSHVQRLETMGEMSGALAHELNQPLAAISNYTSGCLRRLERGETDESVTEAMRLAQAESERAADIIKRMRRFSRNAIIQRVETDMNAVVEDTVALTAADARLRAVTIRTDLTPSLPTVLADTIHMQQVLINLIRNAMDALADAPPKRRRVVVSTLVQAGGDVRVSVADEGTGIDESTRQRLFDPFVTTKAEGMGLGLAICRSIVDAHEGRIWAENNPDAPTGTIFNLVIPASTVPNTRGDAARRSMAS